MKKRKGGGGQNSGGGLHNLFPNSHPLTGVECLSGVECLTGVGTVNPDLPPPPDRFPGKSAGGFFFGNLPVGG